MAAINKIKLKNFRAFGGNKWHEVDLSLINIITGPNNSGKSSITKALLLLMENLESGSFDNLDFTGSSHGLDGFQNAINRSANDDLMAFSIDISNYKYPDELRHESFYHESAYTSLCLPDPQNLTVELHYAMLPSDYGCLKKMRLLHDGKVLFESHNNIDNKHFLYINFRQLLSYESNSYCFDVKNIFRKLEVQLSDTYESLAIEAFFKLVSHVQIHRDQWEKEHSLFDQMKMINVINTLLPFNSAYAEIRHTKFREILPKEPEVKTKDQEKLLNLTAGDIMEASSLHNGNIYFHFENFVTHLNKIFRGNMNLTHLPQNRGEPLRLYDFNGKSKFENLLRSSMLAPFKYERSDFVDDWLSRFGIGDGVEFQKFKNTIDVQIHDDIEETDLANLGTSALYLLPILLAIALSYKQHPTNAQEIDRYIAKHKIERIPNGTLRIKNWSNDYHDNSNPDIEEYKNRYFKKIELYEYSTIIIEEPELALHPDSQSKLAELFVEASKLYNIQFIIETHSEYLIRKLQSLLAQGLIDSSDCSVHYISKDQDISRIPLSETGSFKAKFGPGFFDESTTLKDELQLHQENKRLRDSLQNFNKKYETHIKCIVLTEDRKHIDGATYESAISKILKASGYEMDATEIYSYYSSSKHKVAFGMAEFAEKQPNIERIIIHIDSDGESEKRIVELSKHIKEHGLVKTSAFVTSFNDIEGYFIKAAHINALYPEIETSEVAKMIEAGIKTYKESSIKSLAQKLNGHHFAAKATFESAPRLYTHTKKLKSYINSELSKKVKSPNILQYSDHLRVDELAKIAASIWN